MARATSQRPAHGLPSAARLRRCYLTRIALDQLVKLLLHLSVPLRPVSCDGREHLVRVDPLAVLVEREIHPFSGRPIDGLENSKRTGLDAGQPATARSSVLQRSFAPRCPVGRCSGSPHCVDDQERDANSLGHALAVLRQQFVDDENVSAWTVLTPSSLTTVALRPSLDRRTIVRSAASMIAACAERGLSGSSDVSSIGVPITRISLATRLTVNGWTMKRLHPWWVPMRSMPQSSAGTRVANICPEKPVPFHS